MSELVNAIHDEFHDEIPATRRLLERVSDENLGWKPHPKSRTLGELAFHVANIPGMAAKIIEHDEFSAGAGTPTQVTSADQIRQAFEKSVFEADRAFSSLTPEKASGEWRFLFREKEIFRKKRTAALRTNMLNHLYHHRGQMSVYLRLLEVPVPMVYGPTADENPFA